MSELRWVPLSAGSADCLDATGRLVGFINPCGDGTRAYVMKTSPGLRGACTLRDHPTEEAARAWVEGEVRRLEKTEIPSPVENEER